MEFKSYYSIQPRLKNGTHFSCYRSLPKGTMFKRVNVSLSYEILRHAMASGKVLWQPECVQPPPPFRKHRPLAAQLKYPFGDFC